MKWGVTLMAANYRVRPTKPTAIFSAVVGVAIVVFGIVNLGNKPNNHGLIISTDADQPPHRPGSTTTED